MKSSKFFAFFTAFVLLFALCACSANSPSGNSNSGNLNAETPGDVIVNFENSQQFSSDAGTSIDVLREEIGQSTAQFGMAYIGYFDTSTAEETGIDFGQWFYAASSDVAAYYPFISEIDNAHTIGSEGHLYCVIAKDYEASISVSRIGDAQPLYTAQNGDPILLFCNLDGNAQNADTVVTVKTVDGVEYRWEPTLDEIDYPNLLIGNERELLSWDFTVPVGTGFDLEAWFVDGWLGVTDVGLAGVDNGTDWWIETWDGSVGYFLNFKLKESANYNGEVTLECFYANSSAVQAQWQGQWRIETALEQPSRLYIDMSLCDGADMAAFKDSATISESYNTLIHPSGEYLLLVADDAAKTLNPIFPEGIQAVELTLAVG